MSDTPDSGDNIQKMTRQVRRINRGGAGVDVAERALPREAALALTYNGVSHAVMMVTPENLEDFAIGFTLSEGIVTSLEEIEGLDIQRVEAGLIARVDVPRHRAEALSGRRRSMTGQSSCGICGVEDLEAVFRDLPGVGVPPNVRPDAVFAARMGLARNQPLNAATGGMHGAAYASPDGGILLVREDVGRHNALDKLIGAMARQEMAAADGFLALTSRCSYELVQKAVCRGFTMMATMSAPTDLASQMATQYGLTLLSLVREESFVVVHDPHKRFAEEGHL